MEKQDIDTGIGYYDDTIYDYDAQTEALIMEEEEFYQNIENPFPHFGYVEYYFYATRNFSRLQARFEQQANAYQAPSSILGYPMLVREYPVSEYQDNESYLNTRYSLEIIMCHPQYHRTLIRVYKRSGTDTHPREVALWNGTLKGKALYRMIMAISKLYNCARIEGDLPQEILLKVNRPVAIITNDDGTEDNTAQSTEIITKSADTPSAIPC